MLLFVIKKKTYHFITKCNHSGAVRKNKHKNVFATVTVKSFLQRPETNVVFS